MNTPTVQSLLQLVAKLKRQLCCCIKGGIAVSPDGTRWQVTVTNDGTPTVTPT